MSSIPNPVPVCIPARWSARRFPGKLLAPWGDTTVLEAVIATAEASGVGPVVVLAGDRQIKAGLEGKGTRVELVDAECANGSERIAAALRSGHLGTPTPEFVVNLQGDAVGATPALLRAALDALVARPEAGLATIATWSVDSDNRGRTTVQAHEGLALDFSRRALAPHPVSPPEGQHPGRLLHVGIYAYRTEELLSLAAQPAGPRESEESLEQLRWIENQHLVALHIEDGPASLAHAIDEPSDLQRQPCPGAVFSHRAGR